MAKLPPNKMLRREDFPGQEEWIGKLLESLNANFSALTTALDKGLSVQDNLGGSFVKFTATIPASWADPGPEFPYVFRHEMKRKVIGVTCVKVDDTTDVNTPCAVTGVGWKDNGDGRLSITLVSGLTAGHKYDFTLMLLPE